VVTPVFYAYSSLTPGQLLASLIEPGLTTVVLHPYSISQQAARLFMEQEQLQECFPPRTFLTTSEFIARQSPLKGQGEDLRLAV
jgi:DNA-binding LacI/PurR family transcriptional regulator